MAKKPKKLGTKQEHRHLSPLEVQAIHDARSRGVKVQELAKQYKVSRQSIYYAIKTVKESEARTSMSDAKNDIPAPSLKRHRAKRIPPEVVKAIEDMKRKYPAWGVNYLREQWMMTNHVLLSRASIYRILRDAGLQTRRLVEKETYQRFEMTRPGQLWQMDIEGQFYLHGLKWVYGFAIIDDYSRYCPAFRYFTEATLSNAILLLNEAIGKHGIPEAIYVDNGSQFKSNSERLNNFELFCAAYGIKLVNATPARPQGKGKIERFFETVENQFITWVRARIEENPEYSLAQLNHDLDDYLQGQYHVRVHGSTDETPEQRFFKERLRSPDPPVDVVKFLERSDTRCVSKWGEVSYNGYKIQVALPAKTWVIVVETIETIRIEYGSNLIREIQKNDLSTNPPVKHQDGLSEEVVIPLPRKSNRDPNPQLKHHHHNLRALGPDEEGYYHRRVNSSGNFKWMMANYYIGYAFASKPILVKVVGTDIQVFDEDKNLIISYEIKPDERDSKISEN